jgi:hypothetical protein
MTRPKGRTALVLAVAAATVVITPATARAAGGQQPPDPPRQSLPRQDPLRPDTPRPDTPPADTPRADELLSEKAARTPAQRKIDEKLLYEIYRRQGITEEKRVPPGSTGVKVDPRGRVLVNVHARVTLPLAARIHARGGTVVSSSVEDRSIVAWVPLLELERLAQNVAVRSIARASEPMTIK